MNKLFTLDDKKFLIENGYLILDISKIASIELEDAAETLNRFISNKSFNVLILQPTRGEMNVLSEEEIQYIETNFPNTKRIEDSIDKWRGPQIELEGIMDYVFRNGDNPMIPQIWIEGPDTRSTSLFLNLKLAIAQELYNYNCVESKLENGVLTEFSNYGRIVNHKDAGDTSNRLCVLTFYLNDKSEAEGNGGELILTTDKGERITIPPYKGTAVILDFADNDGIVRNNLEHEVTQIKNNFKRYTYLSGIAL